MIDNPFKILGVDPDADPVVIDAAWKALIGKYHPDKDPSHTRLAAQINAAHGQIRNPPLRPTLNKDRKLEVGRIIGNYRITDEISEQGGFGRTFKAEHLLLGGIVCIKDCSFVDEKFYDRMVQEANAIWDLRHYALPTMRDLIRLEDGSFVLVMSFIPGRTIYDIVDNSGPLDAETVAWIAERLLNALSYIHRHGVIHGDIKPQNIIIQPESHMAVLVDFGLAIVKPSASTKSKGYTELFAPPEEIERLPLVPESDLYSLGMTLIYALTGNLDRVRGKEIPVQVPEEFANFIGKLVRRDVLNRPNWDKEDIIESLRAVRLRSFGRAHSGIKVPTNR